MTLENFEGNEEIMKSHDSWWTTVFAAKVAIRITAAIKDTEITPNQVTIASFTIGILSALCFGTGIWFWLIVGAILLQISFILDCVDGQLARIKRLSSEKGAWLDLTTDIVKVFALYFGLALGSVKVTNNYSLWAWGFIAYFLSVSGMFLFYARPRRLKDESKLLGQEQKNSSRIEKLYNMIQKKAYFLSFSLPDQYLVISVFAVLSLVSIVLKVIVIWGSAAIFFSLARTWQRLSRSDKISET